MPAKKKTAKKAARKKAKPKPEILSPHGLNVRQARFTELVASGKNATRAYIEAGYAARGNAAEVSACQLLRNPKVEAYLAELRIPQKESAIRTKDENLRYLSELIATPIAEIGPDSIFCTEYVEEVVAGGSQGQLKRGQAPSGNENTTPPVLRRKVKKSDPLRAIEIFNRMRGHYEPDRHEIDLGDKTLLSIKERAMRMESVLVARYESREGDAEPGRPN